MATVSPPSCAVSVDFRWNNNLQDAIIVENRAALLPNGSPSTGLIATDADVILWSEVVSDEDRRKLHQATELGSPDDCTVTEEELRALNIHVRIVTVTPKPSLPDAPMSEDLVYFSQVSGAWLHLIDDSAATP